jgi:hypothetical protein
MRRRTFEESILFVAAALPMPAAGFVLALAAAFAAFPAPLIVLVSFVTIDDGPLRRTVVLVEFIVVVAAAFVVLFAHPVIRPWLCDS